MSIEAVNWMDLRIDSVLSTRSQLDYHRALITMVRAAILISLVFAGHVLHAALPAYSMSPSRQFVIYGADATLRGAISELQSRPRQISLPCCDNATDGKLRL